MMRAKRKMRMMKREFVMTMFYSMWKRRRRRKGRMRYSASGMRD